MDIYLKDKEPVTLHTANKYCKEDINVNIESKKINITPNKNQQHFEGLYDEVNVEAVGSISELKSKGVDFIDYDGTLLYTYTVEEAQALTELPELPNHEGLICQGWNWSLEDIKAFSREVVVGAMYITDDGKTRLYISIEKEELKSIKLSYAQSETYGFEVDFGDGSESYTYSKRNTVLNLAHTYEKIGDYIVTFKPLKEECLLYLGGYTSNNSNTLFGSYSDSGNLVYRDMIKKVEIGNNVSVINHYVFREFASLETITIPNTITEIRDYAFYKCNKLKQIVLPNSLVTTGNYTFSEINNLKLPTVSIPNSLTALSNNMFRSSRIKQITIPRSITNIQQYALSYCNYLTKLKIPKSVTNIETSAFSYNVAMQEYDFSEHEQIPTIQSNTFYNLPSTCKIIVPDALYDEWIVATNWSTYATKIVKASEVV